MAGPRPVPVDPCQPTRNSRINPRRNSIPEVQPTGVSKSLNWTPYVPPVAPPQKPQPEGGHDWKVAALSQEPFQDSATLARTGQKVLRQTIPAQTDGEGNVIIPANSYVSSRPNNTGQQEHIFNKTRTRTGR